MKPEFQKNHEAFLVLYKYVPNTPWDIITLKLYLLFFLKFHVNRVSG